MQRVAIIDYGMGNLRSVEKALAFVAGARFEIVLTEDPAVVAEAERVVFPGQGRFGDALARIRTLGLQGCIGEAIGSRPFLGICVGMQALMGASTEDPDVPGLGIFAGTCERFPEGARDPHTGERLKIPHMGWNEVRIERPHPLWRGIADGTRFYFVHSYHVAPTAPGVIAASCEYGTRFVCGLAEGSFFGVQFHPEKSQHPGLTLLGNFLDWNGAPG